MTTTPMAYRILTVIQTYYLVNGVPPTIKEIQQRVGVRSPRAVSYHLEILVASGDLKRAHGHSRSYLPIGYRVIREDESYAVPVDLSEAHSV